MGVLGKLMFWKKKDDSFPSDLGGGMPGEGPDLGLPKPGGLGLPVEEPKSDSLGMPEIGAAPEQQSPNFGAPRLEESKPPESLGQPPGAMPSMGQASAGPSPSMSNKDLEIISLKLDSMKTILETINERIARLEKIAEGEKELPRF